MGGIFFRWCSVVVLLYSTCACSGQNEVVVLSSSSRCSVTEVA